MDYTENFVANCQIINLIRQIKKVKILDTKQSKSLKVQVRSMIFSFPAYTGTLKGKGIGLRKMVVNGVAPETPSFCPLIDHQAWEEIMFLMFA